MKFSVISIDGPFGGKEHSRKEILEFLPDILEDTFAIVLDDVDRPSDRQTVKDIEKILKDNGIEYAVAYYTGMTDIAVIASYDYRFLTSL